MTNQMIVTASLYLYYYFIGGLATTNMLRLTSASTLPVLSSQCNCDNCGSRITVPLQMPIFSYLICRGRCRSCGIKLPLDQLLLELVILFGMSLITSLLDFSVLAATLSFLYYELIRILVILLKGKRKTDFVKQYLIAVGFMFPLYLLVLFLIILRQFV